MKRVHKTVMMFEDGSFYVYRGENLSGNVVHRTNDPLEAKDFTHTYVKEVGRYEYTDGALYKMVRIEFMYEITHVETEKDNLGKYFV